MRWTSKDEVDRRLAQISIAALAWEPSCVEFVAENITKKVKISNQKLTETVKIRYGIINTILNTFDILVL